MKYRTNITEEFDGMNLKINVFLEILNDNGETL